MNNYLIMALGALLAGISIFLLVKKKDEDKEEKKEKRKSSQRVLIESSQSREQFQSDDQQQQQQQFESRFEEEKQTGRQQHNQQDQQSPGQKYIKKESFKKVEPPKPVEVKKPVYQSVQVEKLEGGIAGFDQNEIQDLFIDVFPIQSVDPAQHPLFCIDSRNNNKGLNAPGGDSQIWLLGLRCLEILANQELSIEQIQEGFQNFLKQTKKSKFYMHTDNICINDLKENLQMSQDQMDHFDIHKPPQDMKQIIMENVVKTKYQGCGYIMMMLTNPKGYYQRTNLIEGFIKAFYTELWNNNAKVALDVLEGENTDQGYCIVQTETQFQPQLTNKTDKGSICFHHVKAEVLFKQEVANYLTAYGAKVFSVTFSPQDLINKMNEVGEIQDIQSHKIFTEHIYKYKLTFKE